MKYFLFLLWVSFLADPAFGAQFPEERHSLYCGNLFYPSNLEFPVRQWLEHPELRVGRTLEVIVTLVSDRQAHSDFTVRAIELLKRMESLIGQKIDFRSIGEFGGFVIIAASQEVLQSLSTEKGVQGVFFSTLDIEFTNIANYTSFENHLLQQEILGIETPRGWKKYRQSKSH